MPTSRVPLQIMLTAILAICTSGCGDGRPTLVSARGEVTFRGHPLTAGSVTFYPTDAAAEQETGPTTLPTSLLQIDGSFTMKTFPFGDGVPPGKYKVCLNKSLASSIKCPEYGDPKRTPWEIEVPETGDSAIELEAKSEVVK